MVLSLYVVPFSRTGPVRLTAVEVKDQSLQGTIDFTFMAACQEALWQLSCCFIMSQDYELEPKRTSKEGTEGAEVP